MSKLDEAKIREYDAEGRLIAAGFLWYEMREWPKTVFHVVGTLPFVLLLAACVTAGPDITPRLPVMGVLAAILVASFLPLVFFGFRQRAVIFHADGRTGTPYGIPYARGAKELFPHSEMLSIEASGPNVILYSTEGLSFSVGQRLDGWVARLIAVQLNKALTELRESQANARRARSEPRPQSSRREPASRLID